MIDARLLQQELIMVEMYTMVPAVRFVMSAVKSYKLKTAKARWLKCITVSMISTNDCIIHPAYSTG